MYIILVRLNVLWKFKCFKRDCIEEYLKFFYRCQS